MSLQLSIAVTQLISRRRPTLVSLTGIALGVAFFLAVSSLMRGSERDFIKRLIDNSPHITVSDEYRKAQRQPAAEQWPDGAVEVRRVKPLTEVRGIRGHAQKLAFVESLPGLRAAPVLMGSVVLTFAGRNEGVTLNGIIPAKMKGVSTIEEKLTQGSLEALAANPNGIVIGEGLAKEVWPEHGQRGERRLAGWGGAHPESGRHLPHRQCQLRRESDFCPAQAGARLGPVRPGQLVSSSNSTTPMPRDVAAVIERQVGYKAVSWQESAGKILMSVLLVRT
ncbi:MAG: ABC transporter permease [Candidatus Competibacteraceae bacterium]